jgi:hypothetical protein
MGRMRRLLLATTLLGGCASAGIAVRCGDIWSEDAPFYVGR